MGLGLARGEIMAAACEQRVNLDGEVIKPLKICMIGAGGFIGSHLCEKLMWETEHSVLAIDVYGDKIQHLLQPGHKWSNRIEFHKINIKSDSRLEGLIKVSDLVKRSFGAPSLSMLAFPLCVCLFVAIFGVVVVVVFQIVLFINPRAAIIAS